MYSGLLFMVWNLKKQHKTTLVTKRLTKNEFKLAHCCCSTWTRRQAFLVMLLLSWRWNKAATGDNETNYRLWARRQVDSHTRSEESVRDVVCFLCSWLWKSICSWKTTPSSQVSLQPPWKKVSHCSSMDESEWTSRHLLHPKISILNHLLLICSLGI